MVSLCDTIPCVGKVVDVISEAMVNEAHGGLRYVFCYKSIVNDLNSAIDKFNDQKAEVSTKVDVEKYNGKILKENVSKWQKEVEEIQQDSKKVLERCIQCVPIPNPLSRFRLGREAEQMTKMVAELTESGKKLLANPIARLPPVDNLPKTDGVFQNFASRKDAYDKLRESLVSEGTRQIHGIYGMPGVGKTRIALQIWEDAKTKGKFDKVTIAVVGSEKLDVIKLQNDLAMHLQCSFESQDNVDSRASQLKHSIMNGGKVLIILDDVWREIPLHEIGVPIGHDDTTSSSKGTCKILLTSREKNVLRGNHCIDPVKITALTDDEAWDMFKESVGTHKIESLQDESLAKKVCNKCGGLPIVIRAVGKALMTFESCDMWNAALVGLETCDIKHVPGIDQRVYACLKLSFDRLEKDAMLCLLLCSLYPEDAEIPINMLIELATGSQLVRDGRDGRIRVRAMVTLLKSSSLVLESEYGGDRFKLHDIIRDVARSIAVTVKDYPFLFAKCDSRLLSIDYGSTKLLCLEVEESDDWLNQDIQMAKNDIHTLWIGSAGRQFIRKFQVREVASMFANLRCLILRNMRWEPVQQLGDKLRTLVLEDCDIGNTDFSFILEKLETLSIWRCDLPEPLNIINLKHLRKLQILTDEEEVVLVANTISSISSCLEELHIPYGFKYHKAEGHNDDEVNYNKSISQQLAEFTNLRGLKSLNMSFREVSHDDDISAVQAPKVISNLSEFHLSVGADLEKLSSVSASYPSLTRKSIHLCGKRFEAATFRSLIERAQVVILTSTNVDVSSAFNTNDTAETAFADLKHIEIDGSDTMEHLAKISFFKLTRLRVGNCSAMKYLFCNSVAKCLVQLEELHLNDCPVMEAIVMNEGSSNSDGQEEEEEKNMNIINFPKLKSLRLSSLPKLKSFNIEKKKDIMQHTGSTISLSDNSAFTLFPKEIAFPALEELSLSDMETSDIWGKHYFNDKASSFSKLKKLTVSCTKIETVIPLAMSHKLQNLEYLDIKDCSLVISEVGTYDSNTAAICPLVALTKMHLQKLPCLRNTGLNSILDDHSQAITNLYPNLKELEIQECNSLSNVFLASIARDLMMHLEELKVDDCEMMTEVIGAAAGEHKISIGGIIFPKLRTLHLLNLKNLTSFRRNQSGEANNICKDVLFPNLETCKMWCNKINFKDTEFWRDGVPCQLMSLDIRFDEEMQLIPCTWDLRNLEYLTLANCWWHEQHIIIPSFSRLRTLQVTKSGCSTLFPFSVISSLQQLQRIEISDCALLEDIVTRGNAEASSRDKKIIRLFRLEYVTLKGLPNLRSFMSGADYECHMPALQEVKIDNCGFSSIFTYSTNLQQLWRLEVSNCILLEYIVRDDDDAFCWNTLSGLWNIRLANLPNLKSFGRTSSYDFDMRELRDFNYPYRYPQDARDLNHYIKENREAKMDNSCRIM